MKKLIYWLCLLMTLSMTSCIGIFTSDSEEDSGDFGLTDALTIMANIVDEASSDDSDDPNKPNLLDPNEYCWEITMTATKDGKTGTEVEYQWATGAEMIAFFEMVKHGVEKEAPDAELEVSITKSDRQEENCRQK